MRGGAIRQDLPAQRSRAAAETERGRAARDAGECGNPLPGGREPGPASGDRSRMGDAAGRPRPAQSSRFSSSRSAESGMRNSAA